MKSLTLALVIMMFSTTGFSSDVEKLYNDQCADCHNEDISIIPTVFGFDAEYLRDTMYSFLDESRVEETMFQIVDQLTTEQIEDLVIYMSEKSPCDAKVSVDPLDGDPIQGKEVAKACIDCHGPKGEGWTAPRLSGQRTLYILESINKFKTEYRNNNHTMIYNSSFLSEKDIADVAAYYNSTLECQ